MSSAANKMRVLSLYKQLLREAMKFTSYNYRHYFLRRTKDAFRENKAVTDGDKIKELINLGEQNLAMIKRQVIVGQLYGEGHLIIETKPGNKL